MKRLRRKYPILVSIALVILFVLGSALGSAPLLLLGEEFLTEHLYLAQLMAEVVALALMLAAAWLLGLRPFRGAGKPMGEKLVPCLPLLLLYTFAFLETVILEMEDALEPPLSILWYVLCMLAVGITEELTFRGVITRILYEKYGGTTVGLWLSVLTSSLLFGTVHLTNAAGGAGLGGVLVQVVGAAALGVCLAAIYLRTGSLWTVALLHGFMDFCALASSGLFGSGDVGDLIGGYGLSNLFGALLYMALGLFLLRPAKAKGLTNRSAVPPPGYLIGLMVAVALLAGLFSAVMVLSV